MSISKNKTTVEVEIDHHTGGRSTTCWMVYTRPETSTAWWSLPSTTWWVVRWPLTSCFTTVSTRPHSCDMASRSRSRSEILKWKKFGFKFSPKSSNDMTLCVCVCYRLRRFIDTSCLPGRSCLMRTNSDGLPHLIFNTFSFWAFLN